MNGSLCDQPTRRTAGGNFIRKAAGTARKEQVVAANIDKVFICMSLNNDFNPRRLERYLTVCWESGATPIVVLTKADLCDKLAEKRLAVEAVAMGTDVLVTSAIEQDGCEQILSYIQEGQTVALIGSSGVGKSTLINHLLGEDRMDTNGLRGDDKERHTTTRRELFLLPNELEFIVKLFESTIFLTSGNFFYFRIIFSTCSNFHIEKADHDQYGADPSGKGHDFSQNQYGDGAAGSRFHC